MSYIFEIKTSKDLYNNLQEEYEDLKNDILSSRRAMNCAMMAWHLTDWTFNEYMNKHGFSKLGDYRQSLSCPSLNIMADIANGAKHLIITKPKTGIVNTEKIQGDFSSDFDFNDFWVGSLELKMDDGTTKDFFDEITAVVSFWNDYFSTI